MEGGPETHAPRPPSPPTAGIFPTTQWPLVDRAGDSRATRSRDALDQLICIYRPALMKYLRFVCRVEADQAEDLLQGFLAEKVVRNHLIAHADQRKGRFRTYLKTVLINYLRSEVRRSGAQKRTPDRATPSSLLIDTACADRTCATEPDVFDIEWARTLVQQAIDRFRCECAEAGRSDLWEIVSARLINPILRGSEPETYQSLIARMNYSSPSQVWNALNTGKAKLTHHLRGLIAAYARDESELEEEINDLFAVFSRVER